MCLVRRKDGGLSRKLPVNQKVVLKRDDRSAVDDCCAGSGLLERRDEALIEGRSSVVEELDTVATARDRALFHSLEASRQRTSKAARCLLGRSCDFIVSPGRRHETGRAPPSRRSLPTRLSSPEPPTLPIRREEAALRASRDAECIRPRSGERV